ncbi:MAG: formate--tetrahydrofolate ligase [Pseudomonadota bacterium]
MNPDLQIARAHQPQDIRTVGERVGLQETELYAYGPHIAKITPEAQVRAAAQSPGRLILVTAMTPTPAGEGKTTTTIGLGDGLCKLGKKAMICVREPSLGPSFGMKGGAAGGGYSQVIPMETINLHFTGDLHAVASAHNLLASMIDNHVHHGNSLGIDTRRITFRRTVDLNDRALRACVVATGGVGDGFARTDGFDITAASEVMAILCMARDVADLQARLGRIVIGLTRDREPVTAKQLRADGAMTVLLRDALMPNLVQTLAHNPAFVHGGPFANIAHGCNTIMATRTALGLADYVVTEAGFGADLGAEKFFDIKCRLAGLRPSAVVLVATIRALKMHGGVAKNDLGKENVPALKEGLSNLMRHYENLTKFGVPAVVGINHFTGDSDDEVQTLIQACKDQKIEVFMNTHWADGGAGLLPMAERVVALADADEGTFKPLYPDDMPLLKKIETIAQTLYRAEGVDVAPAAVRDAELFESLGHQNMPVCIAKTQYSFSSDPNLKGAPTGHRLEVRRLRLSAGAGFVVALCGDIMTMPGLPKVPAAESITLNEQGLIEGLF